MIMRESLAGIFAGLDVAGKLALYQRDGNDGATAVANVRHLHANADDRVRALWLDGQLDICARAARVDRRNRRCRVGRCTPLREIPPLQYDLRREHESRPLAAHLLILAIGVLRAGGAILPSEPIPVVDVERNRNRAARPVSANDA